MIVVTPPAAADAVARATPSPGALPVCTWASTCPGRMSCPAGTSIRSVRGQLAGLREHGDAAVRDPDLAVREPPAGQRKAPAHNKIQHLRSLRAPRRGRLAP